VNIKIELTLLKVFISSSSLLLLKALKVPKPVKNKIKI